MPAEMSAKQRKSSVQEAKNLKRNFANPWLPSSERGNKVAVNRMASSEESPEGNFRKRLQKEKEKLSEVYVRSLRSRINGRGVPKKKRKAGGPLHVNKYPGPAPIDPALLEKHSRGEGVDPDGVRVGLRHQIRLEKREALVEEVVTHGARAEVMLTENAGYLEADEGEKTENFTQGQIANAVDITTATKHFNLDLDTFGPYRMDYNRNGRTLLLGGRKGHMAAVDWMSKKLVCEFNVMEEVFAIKWLHFDEMFAVAQRDAVFVYNKEGAEVHCLPKYKYTVQLEYLPYHFLLVTLSNRSALAWLDISVGKEISRTKHMATRAASMVQNPSNAVICLGHQGGTVTMWTPNSKVAVLKMLCDRFPVQAMAMDPRGIYMATSSNKNVKIWDLRALKGCVQHYKLRSPAMSLSISQRGLLAMGMGNQIEIYRNCLSETADQAYMRHNLGRPHSTNLQFCPYEDVLGVAHAKGFTSLIIPGAGEPNYDGLEVNPYQTATQKKEAEVHALLEKIQPEFITYDPSIIATVNVPSLEEKLAATEKLNIFIPPKISLGHWKGKKGDTARVNRVKNILYEDARMKFVKEHKKKIEDKQIATEEKIDKWKKKDGVSVVLERFQWQRK